jgi:hypothetical protein
MCTRSDLLRAWISYKMHTPHPASTACPRPARARSTTTGPGHAPPGPSHAPPYAVHLLLRHPAPLRASAPTAVPARAGQQRRQRRAMRAATMTRCPWTHPARTGWWTVPPDAASWCGEEQTCPLRRCSPGPPTVPKKGLRSLVHISYLQPIQ